MTTQLVPSGFTFGDALAEHYAALEQAHAPALVFDSEILHRGAGTPPPPGRSVFGRAVAAHSIAAHWWASSCSVELCSAAGWKEWLHGTGGTEFSDAPEYRMLPIASG